MKSPLLLLLAATPAAAQTLAPDSEESSREVPLMEIIGNGGVMMFPLAALALITLILIILYTLTIRRGSVVTNRFMNAAETMLRKGDFNALLGYCHRRSELVARLTQKTLHFATENPHANINEIREVAEAEGSRQSGILAQRITWLGDIGAIAPMVGLLGTVIGMIKSFLQISQGNFEGVRQMQLASGVSEALVTTATGLVIGITAMIFHSVFRARITRYLSEFEAASTHIMSLISAQMHDPTNLAPQQALPNQPEQYPGHQAAYPQST
ncbi:MAG: MotA/TolQ/ExbB proton channel family protein [Verrucomicrobiota bacterium]